ncbi:MAG: hypothetical protein ACLTQI_02105 [Slackia sp.]
MHKVVVAREEFDDVARVFARSLEERKKVAGIQPKRAGVFLRGRHS